MPAIGETINRLRPNTIRPKRGLTRCRRFCYKPAHIAYPALGLSVHATPPGAASESPATSGAHSQHAPAPFDDTLPA